VVGFHGRRRYPRAPAPHTRTVARQDLSNGAARRRLLDGVFARQHRLHFLRAPRAMLPGLRGDESLDRFVGALRRVVRPVAAPLQAPQTECGGKHQKLIDLFHISYVGLAHRPLCSPSPRTKWVSPIPQDRTSALGFIFELFDGHSVLIIINRCMRR
jgi:hypothetical protein